ncbi:ATP-binding protein [Humisphaera borealis]|uniref:histidine kinase n=1 Tax=Humisphaera borealis TaxID=2807512 RepID=A0A7M2X047_9BACT|nr:ATP-binding protein [Humisphaera borealis]QOV90461.1 hypothetical protein IPV69_03580 [Humisphaera borealis]
MNLKTQFFLWCSLLLLGVLCLGGFSVWSLEAMSRSSRAATASYAAQDRAESTVTKVAWLRDSFRGTEPRTSDDRQYFASVRQEITEIIGHLRQSAQVDHGDAAAELQLSDALQEHLESAARHAGVGESSEGSGTPVPLNRMAAGDIKRSAEELERLRQSLTATTKTSSAAARHHLVVSSQQLSSWVTAAYVLLAIVTAASVAIFVKQYRSLVRPLYVLRGEMQRSAAREFREEVRPAGQREFRDIAGFFNGLARDLAELYRDLENKVIARSRELVRSERLASVGFLAAGVAHEINNPLSIISGYAELAANGLRRVMLDEGDMDSSASGGGSEAEAEALAAALDAQTIIRDEAFRCKEITSRLLSLARGGTDERKPLCLDDVARQVAVLTKGLKNYNDRNVLVDFRPSDVLDVVANPTEIKQVLLNLTINALEAVSPGTGQVRIAGKRAGEWVELSVEDNGKGMSRETLEHVFEPFFTAKRGVGEPGTGLGLSITHAIIENHGGRISAESAGVGRGSRFILRLPALVRAVAAAAAVTAVVNPL